MKPVREEGEIDRVTGAGTHPNVWTKTGERGAKSGTESERSDVVIDRNGKGPVTASDSGKNYVGDFHMETGALDGMKTDWKSDGEEGVKDSGTGAGKQTGALTKTANRNAKKGAATKWADRPSAIARRNRVPGTATDFGKDAQIDMENKQMLIDSKTEKSQPVTNWPKIGANLEKSLERVTRWPKTRASTKKSQRVTSWPNTEANAEKSQRVTRWPKIATNAEKSLERVTNWPKIWAVTKKKIVTEAKTETSTRRAAAACPGCQNGGTLVQDGCRCLCPQPWIGNHCEVKRQDVRIGAILEFDKQNKYTKWQKTWDSMWPKCRFLIAVQLNYYCNKYVEECCPGAKPDFSPYLKRKPKLFVMPENIEQIYNTVLPSGRLEVSLHAQVPASNDLCQKAIYHKNIFSHAAKNKVSWLLLSNAMVNDISTISSHLKTCCNITLKAMLPAKSTNIAAKLASSKPTSRAYVISDTTRRLDCWIYAIAASLTTAIIFGLVVLLTCFCRKKEEMKTTVYRQERRGSIPGWVVTPPYNPGSRRGSFSNVPEYGQDVPGFRRGSFSNLPQCDQDKPGSRRDSYASAPEYGNTLFPLPPTYDPYKFLDPSP